MIQTSLIVPDVVGVGIVNDGTWDWFKIEIPNNRVAVVIDTPVPDTCVSTSELKVGNIALPRQLTSVGELFHVRLVKLPDSVTEIR